MHGFYKDPRISARLQVGPLGPHLASYAKQLKDQRYGRAAALERIRLIADFSGWCDQHGIRAREVSAQHTEQFLHDRMDLGYRRRGFETSALAHLLMQLGHRAITVESPAPPVLTPAARIQAEFDRYLQQQRGLMLSTRRGYLWFVSRFLTERFGTDAVKLSALTADNVTTFVRQQAARFQPATSQAMTTALRIFFRFARQRGDLTADLAAAVPSVAHWSLAAIPQALTSDQVARVLASCDTQTAIGRRDLAILLLLARYGLRGGEVAALTLDDIDWAAGRLTIHGKGRRLSQLPLLHDVGTALATYLQQDRPTGTTCRHVFMRMPAPAGAFKAQGAVGDVVRRALKRAGIAAVHKGSHVLRHSVATQMLRRGASLAEIGELLRHRNPRTTTIYAKVDLTALRTVAAAWPGGAQ
jgi:site-specific recombinase XerD